MITSRALFNRACLDRIMRVLCSGASAPAFVASDIGLKAAWQHAPAAVPSHSFSRAATAHGPGGFSPASFRISQDLLGGGMPFAMQHAALHSAPPPPEDGAAAKVHTLPMAPGSQVVIDLEQSPGRCLEVSQTCLR